MMPLAAFLIAALLTAAPAWAQTPSSSSTGVGSGSTAVDPSKNVLDALLAAVTRLNDLIMAYHKRQDDLRDKESQFQNSMREADIRRLNELREAETRRIDQLALQKQSFDLELARIIKSGVDGNALLLAAQVKELKSDSDVRTAKLEQFANEQRGRTEGGSAIWAAVVVGAGLLIGVGGLLTGVIRAGPRNNEHERGDAERYRQYIDRKVSENGKTL